MIHNCVSTEYLSYTSVSKGFICKSKKAQFTHYFKVWTLNLSLHNTKMAINLSKSHLFEWALIFYSFGSDKHPAVPETQFLRCCAAQLLKQPPGFIIQPVNKNSSLWFSKTGRHTLTFYVNESQTAIFCQQKLQPTNNSSLT